eukprot:1542388-Pleurochrysis_carterae.AAC.4
MRSRAVVLCGFASGASWNHSQSLGSRNTASQVRAQGQQAVTFCAWLKRNTIVLGVHGFNQHARYAVYCLENRAAAPTPRGRTNIIEIQRHETIITFMPSGVSFISFGNSPALMGRNCAFCRDLAGSGDGVAEEWHEAAWLANSFSYWMLVLLHGSPSNPRPAQASSPMQRHPACGQLAGQCRVAYTAG